MTATEKMLIDIFLKMIYNTVNTPKRKDDHTDCL